MNSKLPQYKYEPELQKALKGFINTIDNIYDILDLKLTNDEKNKIQIIRNQRK